MWKWLRDAIDLCLWIMLFLYLLLRANDLFRWLPCNFCTTMQWLAFAKLQALCTALASKHIMNVNIIINIDFPSVDFTNYFTISD